MITLISLIFAIIGGINWLVIGIADFNIINAIFMGNAYWVARVIYILVGLACLWLIGFAIRRGSRADATV